MENLGETNNLKLFWFNLLSFIGVIALNYIVVFPGETTWSYCVVLQSGFPRRYKSVKFESFAKGLRRVKGGLKVVCYRIIKDGRHIIFFALKQHPGLTPSQKVMRNLATYHLLGGHYLGPDFFAPEGNQRLHPGRHQARAPSANTTCHSCGWPHSNDNTGQDPAEASTDTNSQAFLPDVARMVHATEIYLGTNDIPPDNDDPRDASAPNSPARSVHELTFGETDLTATNKRARNNNDQQPTDLDPGADSKEGAKPAHGPNNNYIQSHEDLTADLTCLTQSMCEMTLNVAVQYNEDLVEYGYHPFLDDLGFFFHPGGNNNAQPQNLQFEQNNNNTMYPSDPTEDMSDQDI